MTRDKDNFIRPGEHGSQVVLDPEFLLRHSLYISDGKTIIKSSVTVGQAIEAIAFAHVKEKMPDLAEKCNAVKIEFKDGKFVVCFADSIDHLSL